MKSARIFCAALAALCAAPLLFVACSDHHDEAPVTGACSDPTMISLPVCPTEERFSDEACQTFDDRTRNSQVTANDMRAPALDAPTEGQAVPSASPFTFRWTAPIALRPLGPPGRVLTLADELGRWTTLVPEAQAHCEPFTGRGYDLIFRVGGNVVLRRQQSGTSWTPDAATWTRFRTAAGTASVEFTVQTATFNANQITTGAGPFVQTTPRRFTLAP